MTNAPLSSSSDTSRNRRSRACWVSSVVVGHTRSLTIPWCCLAGWKRPTIGEVLIKSDDERVMLDGPGEDGFIAMAGQSDVASVVDHPGRPHAAKPRSNRARNVLVKQDDQTVTHAE
jgi:hypothetical protein